MMYDLLLKNRTIRKFKRQPAPTLAHLRELVECARLSASARNLQRLRYFLISDEADAVYPMISLGGALSTHQKPTAENRPSAYIAILAPENAEDSTLFIDIGIAAEVITLAAAEKGIGCCMVKSFLVEKLKHFIDCDGLTPQLLIALGYPDEEAGVVDIDAEHGISYYKNEDGKNLVPKRSLAELIVGNR